MLAFSAQVGSNKTSWANYESGKQAPDLYLLIRIHQLTGASIDWIANGGESASAPLDEETLAAIIRGIEGEMPNLEPGAKAKLIVRFYEEFRKRGAESSQGEAKKKASG